MFVESITLWEKSEYGSVKQQKLYKGDMVDMEEKNTCIYLTIADITLITVVICGHQFYILWFLYHSKTR